jgi:outer membrane protein OmpA-like peptidoglycan-associated protein
LEEAMSLLATTLLALVVAADPGTAVFPLLKIGQGPRAAAMGEAFTALSDDATAIYWNPAGLGKIARPNFALTHQEWFASIRDEMGHAAIPLGPGALGLGLVYTGMNDVRTWQPNEPPQSFNLWSGILHAGYGLPLGESYQVGASLTGLFEDLKLAQGMGGALNLGLTGQPVENLGIGVAARHLGVMTYDGAMKKLPAEVAAGATYRWSMFNFALDGVYQVIDQTPGARFGVEFAPIKELAIRAGYRSAPVNLDGLGYLSGLTAGLGVTIGNFGVDYAFVPYGALGFTHRIGIRTVIPEPVLGDYTVCVVDAVTGEPITADIAFSGAATDAVVATAHSITAKVNSRGAVRATAENYGVGVDSFRIQTEPLIDTIYLRRIKGELVVAVFDAKTKNPIGGNVAWTGPENGSVAVPADAAGKSAGTVLAGSYRFDADGPTEEYLSQDATADVDAYRQNRQEFYLWKKGDILSLMVNFETGKADILPEFYPVIDEAGRTIKQTPQIKRIELSGHTDPRKISTPEFPSNVELSQARAEAIRKYLIDKFGIAPERIVAKGYADTRPLVPNTSPENMYKNRRTELRILE